MREPKSEGLRNPGIWKPVRMLSRWKKELWYGGLGKEKRGGLLEGEGGYVDIYLQEKGELKKVNSGKK